MSDFEEMEVTKRIEKMEEILNRSADVLKTLEEALDAYHALKLDLTELKEYYDSPVWLSDFEKQEAGELPEDLRCGVLSEDVVYNLLSDEKDLKKRMQDLAK